MSQNKTKSNNLEKNSKIVKIIALLFKLIGKKSKKNFLSLVNHLVEAYNKQGLLTIDEKQMFLRLASLSDKKIVNMMTPRSDIIAIGNNESLANIRKIIIDKAHSRLPVFKNNSDEIIGFIHSKDLAQFIEQDNSNFNLNKILRKILFVPCNIKPLDLMLRMKIARIHIAIVLDEFGAVDGLITIEDIVEEIIGEIEDEYDLPSDNSFFRIKKIKNNLYHIGSRVEISKIEEIFDIKIDYNNHNFQTVGGLTIAIFKKIPQIGEEINFAELNFKIIDADNRIVKMIEISKNEIQDDS